MIHPKSRLAYIGDHIGYGVVATGFIPKGSMTYVKDDLEISISPRRFNSLSVGLQAEVEKYSYRTKKGSRIISWDIAKYMNHSCHPNTISTGWGFEMAIRDIHEGEEITDEYGLFNMDYNFPLNCQEQGCRGMIYPDDIDKYGETWDQWIVEALKDFNQVEQPLLAFMDKRTVNALAAYLSGRRKYISVKNLKYIGPTGSIKSVNSPAMYH
ncbi:MAG: SET domain-containing protein [Spirochaetales bacterium]|nr:SET domain-containing protein [Spirochaetales bacterium]